jgi:hypothetical protein
MNIQVCNRMLVYNIINYIIVLLKYIYLIQSTVISTVLLITNGRIHMSLKLSGALVTHQTLQYNDEHSCFIFGMPCVLSLEMET